MIRREIPWGWPPHFLEITSFFGVNYEIVQRSPNHTNTDFRASHAPEQFNTIEIHKAAINKIMTKKLIKFRDEWSILSYQKLSYLI